MTNIASYRDDSGSVQRDRDVSDAGFRDRSAAQQRTRVARVAALGEMTGGIVHDFRNILAVVESGLRLAATNFEDPKKALGYITEAQDGIARGRGLASQLLTFAKMPERLPRACDVNVLLRRLEKFLRCGVSPGVKIALVLAPQVPKCLIDESQFTAAVLNLVLNARDAMPNGGEVQISTQAFDAQPLSAEVPATPAHVRIRVSDSGLGMSTGVIDKIFDPFFTTKGEAGTGLGLSQVSACMRLHGGHINVVSRVGSGTAVELFFPVTQRQE